MNNTNYGLADIPAPEFDCPCGGWDCSGSPSGPMRGCPYFKNGKIPERELNRKTASEIPEREGAF